MQKAVLIFVVALAFFSSAMAGHKGKRIEIVLSQQKVIAWEGGKKAFEFHCSTGRKGLDTPVGSTTVQVKERVGQTLPEFGGGKLYYVLKIHLYDPRQRKVRRIDIHAYKSVPMHPASHGCVRLRLGDAKRLFAWAPIGTKVVVENHPEL